MVVKECLSFGVEVLKNRLETELILANILHQPREFLLTHPELALDEPTLKRFQVLMRQRERGIPLAYLTHHKEFYGLDFYVDERVMIPRPETELLVELVIGFCKTFSLKNPTLLDVGTGSGNIAISLAKNLSQAHVLASDISQDALEVARKNAESNGVFQRVRFLESDLLENIDMPVDIIVTNLPYIGTEKFSFVEQDVKRNEPNQALFGGSDGLRLYEELFQQINLEKIKFLCGEFGFLQREMLETILNKFFAQNPVFHQDLQGLDRAFTVVF